MTEVVEVKTIGEVERIVLASGEFDGQKPVEFSNNGAEKSWSEVWIPSEEFPHPVFARTAVYRKGVRLPQEVTIRWDEQVPVADPDWAAKWANSPMRHFGRTARMVAFRQLFRDLLGDIAIEDEAPGELPAPESPAPVDWAAAIAAAATVEDLDEIVRAARKARVFTPDAAGTALDRAWKARRKDMTAPQPEPVVTAKPAPPATVRPEPSKPRSQKQTRARKPPRNRVADNIDSDVAKALRAIGGAQAKQ